MSEYHQVVADLQDYVETNGLEDRFERAVKKANSQGIRDLAKIKSFKDYLAEINKLLHWVPSEHFQGRDVYNHLCRFYFVLDQDPVKDLQTEISPLSNPTQPTFISRWIIEYGIEMGKFMDTPESLTAKSLQSFRESPSYNMDEYIEPRGGWRTFNDFFARNFKPGYRPVAAVSDQRVIVSPADSTFDGQWEIRSDSGVTLKNMHWRISELLAGSRYANRFEGGIFSKFHSIRACKVARANFTISAFVPWSERLSSATCTCWRQGS